jgi:hypothetical protein
MMSETPPAPANAPTAPAADPESARLVADNLAGIRRRIAAAADAAGRPAAAVELVAVSKVQPDARIAAALAAGQRVFGENRVQEAQGRWPKFRAAFPDIRLHLIGPLQTNKAADAVALFDVIESVDREKLARALAKEFARQGVRRDCLVQVNTGAEPQKAGVLPEDLGALLTLCREELDLPVRGLMCIPPIDENPALHFALLAELAADHGLDWLSMGMSADFETGIRHGATHVRVGTAVFGDRATR